MERIFRRQESIIYQEVYNVLEQAHIDEELWYLPTLDEVRYAINQAKRYKDSGLVAISAETLT